MSTIFTINVPTRSNIEFSQVKTTFNVKVTKKSNLDNVVAVADSVDAKTPLKDWDPEEFRIEKFLIIDNQNTGANQDVDIEFEF